MLPPVTRTDLRSQEERELSFSPVQIKITKTARRFYSRHSGTRILPLPATILLKRSPYGIPAHPQC